MKVKTTFKIILLIVFGLICLSILFPNEDTCDLGGGYEYYADNNAIFGPIDIPPFIVNYNYNERYIIAQQDPQGRNPDAIYYDKMNYKYPMGTDSVYYWIIDKTNNNYYGPFLYADFLEKCREKKINLTFDRSKDKKP